MSWMKQNIQENVTYLVVWGLLFAAPLLSLYVRTFSDENVKFDWAEVFFIWRKFVVYLLLFLVHNFLLAPLLVYRHKRVMYFSFVAVLFGAFAFYQCSSKPEKPSGPPPHEMTFNVQRSSPSEVAEPSAMFNVQRSRLEPPPAPPKGERQDGHEFRPADAPPPIIGERDILSVVVLVLLFGANRKLFPHSAHFHQYFLTEP